MPRLHKAPNEHRLAIDDEGFRDAGTDQALDADRVEVATRLEPVEELQVRVDDLSGQYVMLHS